MTVPGWRESPLLEKGLEEEVYTGTLDGDIVGLSHRVARALPGFHCEPDARNTEYATEPHRDYGLLGHAVLEKRCQLRAFIRELGGYTLVPGGALSTGDTGVFVRSKPQDPYHEYIEQTYGSRVVTASTHINIGIHDPELAVRAYRVVRAEAALYLALTATSPFLDDRATGYHSIRWATFPMTPNPVPFFESHARYLRWVEEHLATRAMYNPRHLWLSVRPNGHHPPIQIHRLELRVCDRIDDPPLVLAATALLEARAREVIEDPELDPLKQSPFSGPELEALALDNEQRAARSSLDAVLRRWEDGREIRARDWIAERLEGARAVAGPRRFAAFLDPVEEILDRGNMAMRWLAAHQAGTEVRTVIRDAIQEIARREDDCACRGFLPQG